MPLSPAEPRQLLSGRTITCRGYLRDDGLMDVEGQLVDIKGFDHSYGARPTVPAGQPIHEMWVRVTIDDEFTIRAVVSSTDAGPYPTCREIHPNLQRLLGLRIAGGFKQEMRSRVGGTEGCTHVVTLLEALANVAVHTAASKQRGRGRDAIHETFGVRDRSRPPLIDTCYTYAASSPVVKQNWPQYYRPREAGSAPVDASSPNGESASRG